VFAKKGEGVILHLENAETEEQIKNNNKFDIFREKV